MQKTKGGRPPGPSSANDSFEGYHDLRRIASGDPFAGTVIHGRYEILGSIGQGGMAKIYLANDRTNGSRVAVKILSDNPERNDELAERLFREAKAAATICHPNVIDILDIGTFKDKTFCVMEYLEGRDLASTLLNREPMEWGRAMRILAQVCDAVEAAHGKGVIHRDLKPENVMLVGPTGDEAVKVLDFGLAKLTDNARELTRENIILGTPKYMAPEQAWSREYDHRVDIYALGVIAYELACGTPPFFSDIKDDKARTFQILLMHKETAPEPPSQRYPGLKLPKDAEAAIMRALEKDPAKRFRSAAEMKAALVGPKAAQEARKPVAATTSIEVSYGIGPMAPHEAPEGDMEGSASQMERMAPWSLPPEEKRFGESAIRFAKRAAAIGLAAAALFVAYQKRDAIVDMAGNAFKPDGVEAQARTETERQPAQAAPANTSYQSKIESSPRNAAVYDITGGMDRRVPLGRTPLETTFQNFENIILVVKPGYVPAKATITRSQPDQRVNLRQAPRQGGTSADEARGSGPNGSGGGNENPQGQDEEPK